MAAKLHPPASSALALAHQSFEPASLEDSLFAIRLRERRPCDRPDRGVTLGQVLARAREAVEAHGAAGCPVCGGEMHASLLGAECADCHSRLS